MRIKKIYHSDHGISERDILSVVELLAPKDGLFVLCDNPGGSYWCGLYGPLMGDNAVGESKVTYERRGDRENLSRMIDLPYRKTAWVTVIGVREGDDLTIYTSYGGKPAEREPGDPTIAGNAALIDNAERFWAVHALSNHPYPKTEE